MSNTINKIKVAIIEDEESIRQLYEYKFEHEGFIVVSAENGVAGLQLIRKHDPDLILLDLSMPVMNGDEMLEKLRSHNWGANARVVILTNISKDEAPRSLQFLGVDRYIVKAHHTPTQVVQIAKEILRI
jgi:two-component system alkaline phosphatase synthesis response regulator PhoP